MGLYHHHIFVNSIDSRIKHADFDRPVDAQTEMKNKREPNWRSGYVHEVKHEKYRNKTRKIT